MSQALSEATARFHECVETLNAAALAREVALLDLFRATVEAEKSISDVLACQPSAVINKKKKKKVKTAAKKSTLPEAASEDDFACSGNVLSGQACSADSPDCRIRGKTTILHEKHRHVVCKVCHNAIARARRGNRKPAGGAEPATKKIRKVAPTLKEQDEEEEEEEEEEEDEEQEAAAAETTKKPHASKTTSAAVVRVARSEEEEEEEEEEEGEEN